jgi:hypothetical protein
MRLMPLFRLGWMQDGRCFRFDPISEDRRGDVLCMAINTNLDDVRSLKNIPAHRQYSIRGYENGSGKDPVR